PDPLARAELRGEVADEDAIAVSLGDPVQVEHRAAETGRIPEAEVGALLRREPLLLLLGARGLEPLDARLLLAGAGGGGAADPGQLPLDQPVALLLLHGEARLPLGLRLQVLGVPAREGGELGA